MVTNICRRVDCTDHPNNFSKESLMAFCITFTHALHDVFHLKSRLCSCPPQDLEEFLFLGILERRILYLVIEIAALVVANKVRADILIAGCLSGLRLMFKS